MKTPQTNEQVAERILSRSQLANLREREFAMKFILDSLKWKNPFDAIKASWLSDTTYPGYSDFVENEILNSDLITRILDHITGKD